MKLIKKTDKLVLFPFIRLFLLVLIVTLFIILVQFILIWFEELVGKDLGFWVYLKLLWFFGINATPFAMPLAALVASLMTLGSLGEQLELTGLKSAGIPFFQVIRPLLCFVVILSGLAYWSNGYIVPKVTVKAYALLYDLRKTKPAVAIKEGTFYKGIPGYSIRVEKKLSDNKTLEGIMIYKYEKNKPLPSLTVAQSGRLTNLEDGKYLVIELFNGHTYVELTPSQETKSADNVLAIPDFYRVNFGSQRVLIHLDDFKLSRTKESYFTYYHSTKNNKELVADLDSLADLSRQATSKMTHLFEEHYALSQPVADTSSAGVSADSIRIDTSQVTPALPTPAGRTANQMVDTTYAATHSKDRDIEQVLLVKSLPQRTDRQQIIQKALSNAQDIKRNLASEAYTIKSVKGDANKLTLEYAKRSSYAVACLVMLLIGASLGGLIKRGGFGVPLLISTIFIMIYYMVDVFAMKWAKVGFINPSLGAWASNLVLLPFGLFFLLQAQRDTRLLDGDVYRMMLKRIGLRRQKAKKEEPS